MNSGYKWICNLYPPIVLLFSLFFSCSFCDSANTDYQDKNSWRLIESQLNQLFEYCNQNSFFTGSVLISHHNKVIFKESFGLADRENRIPNTSAMNFNVGSTTKPFTAMAIAILKEQGKLDFDDSVVQHLSEFPYPSITLRHLLTHTSGLPDYVHRPPFIKYHDFRLSDTTAAEPLTNQDVLNWLIEPRQELVFEPGNEMSYCNTGYILLAMIIERVSGQTYPDFVTKNILIPADMRNSGFYSIQTKEAIQNRVLGYRPTLDRTGMELNDMNRMDGGILGDGGLYTSAEDLFRFDQALYSNILISKSTLDEIFSPAVLNSGERKGYGLGWILSGYDNPEPVIVKHGGKWRGFTTAFQRLIEDSSVVIILTNCSLTGPTIGSIRDAATGILMGNKPDLPRFPIADRIAEVLFAHGADSAVQLYRHLAEYERDKFMFDEQELNLLGYRLMWAKRLEDARIILEENARAYPGSSNVYDGLGDINREIGDFDKARKAYQRALEIDPGNKISERKLKNITENKAGNQ